MTVAKAIQLIKGEAALGANKIFLVELKLEWTDEYFAVSISESLLDKL